MMSDKARTSAPPAGVVTRDELWAENERLRSTIGRLEKVAEVWMEHDRKLRAENERLRGLLREVSADDATAVGLESEIREALGDSAVPGA